MKVSDFVEMIKNGDDKKQLGLVYAILLLSLPFMMLVFPLSIENDTPSYYEAAHNLLNGEIDIFRTPVYPMIILIAEKINADYANHFVYFFQYAVFLLSVLFLYKTGKLFIKSRILLFALVLLYWFNPVVQRSASNLMTESFSCSFLVIYTYYYLQSLKEGKFINVLLAFVFLILIVFIRPTFIYMVALMIIISLVNCFFKKKKMAVANLVMSSLVAIMYIAYCSAYNQKYGVFTMSNVGDVNQYVLLSKENMLDASLTDNEALRIELQSLIDDNIPAGFGEPHRLIDKYGYPEVHKVVVESIKKNAGRYAAVTLQQFMPALAQNNPIARFVLYSLIYLTLIVYLALIIQQLYVKKDFPMLSLFVWLEVAGYIFITIIGAGLDFRLIMPVVIFLFLMALHIFEHFKIREITK